jgi:hypothetical protein
VISSTWSAPSPHNWQPPAPAPLRRPGRGPWLRAETSGDPGTAPDARPRRYRLREGAVHWDPSSARPWCAPVLHPNRRRDRVALTAFAGLANRSEAFLPDFSAARPTATRDDIRHPAYAPNGHLAANSAQFPEPVPSTATCIAEGSPPKLSSSSSIPLLGHLGPAGARVSMTGATRWVPDLREVDLKFDWVYKPSACPTCRSSTFVPRPWPCRGSFSREAPIGHVLRGLRHRDAAPSV